MGVDSFSGGDTGLTPSDPTTGTVALGGTLNVSSGGTGAESLPTHNLIVGRGTSTPVGIPPVEAAFVLTDNGPGVDPSMQAPALQAPDVAHSGTGVDAITAHGIVVGRGTSPIVTVNPVQAGFFLGDNGPGNDPSMQSVFPPSAAPPLQTYAQDAWTAGKPCFWFWGNVEIDAPVRIQMDASRNSSYFSFAGATVSPSNIYPVDTTIDMVTFIIDNSAPGTNIAGFYLLEGTFIGVNSSSVQVCRNCVALACQLNVSGIYGGYIAGCAFVAGARSGLQLYGSVFEFTLVGNFARDNGFAGIEMVNPNVSGAGVISSIKFVGGDYRTNGTGGASNGYGIASTSESAFQEAFGFHIEAGDFINNTSCGVYAAVGCIMVRDCHLENNCDNTSETAGQIWVPGGGGINIDTCDSAFITSNPGIYLLEIDGLSGGFAVLYGHNSSLNESNDTPSPIGHLLGTGSAWIENFDDPSHYVGVGGWAVNKNSVTTTTV